MERKWVVAAFLDLTGFRSWTYRAGTSPEMKEEFIKEFYRVLQDYVRKYPGTWSKYEGDGILTVREFSPPEKKEQRSMLNFLMELKFLLQSVQEVIKNSHSSPTGVRMRIAEGYVYKLMVVDPHDPKRERLIPEYLEYLTNTVRGLLEVNPEIPCLVTEGLLKNLGKGGSIFRMQPLGKPSYYPKGINKEDVDGLEILKF